MLSSDKVAQGFIYCGLKNFQGWNLCTNLCPLLCWPHSECFFFFNVTKTFCLLSFILPLHITIKILASSSPRFPVDIGRLLPEPSLLQAKHSHCPQPSLTGGTSLYLTVYPLSLTLDILSALKLSKMHQSLDKSIFLKN